MAVICGQCDCTFNTGHALEQHRRDSPAHAVPYNCEECDRAFNTEEALEQHRRNSPAHSVKHDCEECNRAFNTEQALEQHRRDSPAHSVKHNCEECNRTFGTEQALKQHLHDSPAHVPSKDTEQLDQSFDIRPTRHQDVSKLLRQYGLSFGFFPVDDPHGCLKEHDTSVMGRFTCTSSSCSSSRWTSKKIAISIRQYSGLRYNARVYYQRCQSCDSLSAPELDDSYAERVSYRLAKWSGIAVEEPHSSGESKRPHQARLCEGCKHGHCQQSRF